MPPQPPGGRSQGHAPSPISQRLGQGRIEGQETGGGVGGQREPILRLPLILTHECTKPGPTPKMSWSRERVRRGWRDTAPPKRFFTSQRSSSKSHPKVHITNPWGGGQGASEGGSEPPPLPPEAPLPRPGAGPLSHTWSPRGQRARHTPPHPPRRGHVGASPEAPPALLHVGGALDPPFGWVLRDLES